MLDWCFGIAAPRAKSFLRPLAVLTSYKGASGGWIYAPSRREDPGCDALSLASIALEETVERPTATLFGPMCLRPLRAETMFLGVIELAGDELGSV